jgi:hypothetical protein
VEHAREGDVVFGVRYQIVYCYFVVFGHQETVGFDPFQVGDFGGAKIVGLKNIFGGFTPTGNVGKYLVRDQVVDLVVGVFLGPVQSDRRGVRRIVDCRKICNVFGFFKFYKHIFCKRKLAETVSVSVKSRQCNCRAQIKIIVNRSRLREDPVSLTFIFYGKI